MKSAYITVRIQQEDNSVKYSGYYILEITRRPVEVPIRKSPPQQILL